MIRSLKAGSGSLLAVALTFCAAVTLPRFLLDSTDSIQPASLPWALVLTFYWCAPLAVLVAFARTSVLGVVGAGAYVIGTGFWLAAVYRNEDSTAAFGVFFGPLYFGVGVAVLLAVEALWIRMAGPKRRSPSDSMPRSSS